MGKRFYEKFEYGFKSSKPGCHLLFTDQSFVYEKFFRDKVREFLQNSNVKLFRSPTEGNFLVKLMNVNYSPNQSLGRKQ